MLLSSASTPEKIGGLVLTAQIMMLSEIWILTQMSRLPLSEVAVVWAVPLFPKMVSLTGVPTTTKRSKHNNEKGNKEIIIKIVQKIVFNYVKLSAT